TSSRIRTTTARISRSRLRPGTAPRMRSCGNWCHRREHRLRFATLFLILMSRFILVLFAAFPLHAAWQAGAASVDITPTESIWLAGYASRTKPSESVRQPIHCKALALKDDAGAVSVIVTLDLVGFKREMMEPIAQRAAAN